MNPDRELLAKLAVEPLDRDKHDHAGFSCGVEALDRYLQNYAAKQADRLEMAIFVACEHGGGAVLGYYALRAHAIEISTLPETEHKKFARYPTVPAVYLSMLATATTHQGRGIGSWLLRDALLRCLAAQAQGPATRFVVLDALSDRVVETYRKAGFVELPSHPRRMLIDLLTVKKALAKR